MQINILISSLIIIGQYSVIPSVIHRTHCNTKNVVLYAVIAINASVSRTPNLPVTRAQN